MLLLNTKRSLSVNVSAHIAVVSNNKVVSIIELVFNVIYALRKMEGAILFVTGAMILWNISTSRSLQVRETTTSSLEATFQFSCQIFRRKQTQGHRPFARSVPTKHRTPWTYVYIFSGSRTYGPSVQVVKTYVLNYAAVPNSGYFISKNVSNSLVTVIAGSIISLIL